MMKRWSFLWMVLLGCCLFACGGGGSDGAVVSPGGGGPQAAGPGAQAPATATLRLEHVLLPRGIPNTVTALRVTALDAANQVVFGPTTEARQSVLVLTLPVTATLVRVEYLSGATVVGVYQQQLQLSSGATTTISDPPFIDATGTLESLSLVAAPSQLQSGQTVQLSLQGSFSDGSTQELANQATWMTSNASVVGVTQSGSVSGANPGSATITAEFFGRATSASITVLGAGFPGPTPTPSGSPTPTPSPTGSPTPSPTPSGSPTPSPTPSGSPTPTPSPTSTPGSFVINSGVHTFDTDTGRLDGVVVPEWQGDALVLSGPFHIGAGVTLNIVGRNIPAGFGVVTTSTVTVEGAIVAKGADGGSVGPASFVAGTGGLAGPSGGDGGRGSDLTNPATAGTFGGIAATFGGSPGQDGAATGVSGGGGGGHVNPGQAGTGDGVAGAPGGPSYMSTNPLAGGSAGGGGGARQAANGGSAGGGGGGGGGVLFFRADGAILITGILDVRGGNGGNSSGGGGGGGGAGGNLEIISSASTVNTASGTLLVNGGAGGTGLRANGGAGSIGRLFIAP